MHGADGALMHYHADMLSPEAAALAYVRFVLKQMDISPSALAQGAGISSTTLTRPLNKPGHKFAISTPTLNKIAQFSGISFAPFFDAPSTEAINDAVLFKPEIVFDPTKWPNETHDLQDMEFTLFAGEVAAGHWREVEASDFLRFGPLDLRLSRTRPKDTFACMVRGTSINRVAQDGEILLCIKHEAAGDRPGEVAIVERLSEDGRLVELTAKRALQRGDGSWILRYDSDDPRFQGELEVASLDDSTMVSIVGWVEYVVRQPERKSR